MLVVSLAMALILSADAPRDPSTLIEELGSSRYARREAAEAALMAMGHAVVPGLKAARTSPDPEIRARSSAILERIEQALLLQATPITLDFRGETLAVAVARTNARTGLGLAMSPVDHPAWSAPLTCREPHPLPFWTAMDALCLAGRVHYDFGASPRPGHDAATFPLYPGEPVPLGPVSDSGPFRVLLASIHFQSDLTLSGAAPAAGSRAASIDDPAGRRLVQPQRQFYFQIVVAAEPRLSVLQDGPARVFVAEDEQGHSLLLPAGPEMIQRSAGYLGLGGSPTIQARIDLARPEQAADQIRFLRGVIPVVVTARKPGAVTLRLTEAAGRSFRAEEATLTVEAVHAPDAHGGTRIDLAYQPDPGRPGPDESRPRHEPSPKQVEILDARGNPLAWFPAKSSFDGGTTRSTITVSPSDGAAPVSIRFHEISRARVEVPFTFRSIAMP